MRGQKLIHHIYTLSSNHKNITTSFHIFNLLINNFIRNLQNPQRIPYLDYNIHSFFFYSTLSPPVIYLNNFYFE